MGCILISDLRIGNQEQCIRVRASRVWNRRGGLHDEVTDIRMVLIDEKGNSMYAIVRGNLVAQYIGRLHESATYELMLFKVSAPNADLNPVENPLIIVFTNLTNIRPVINPSITCPEQTYRLTSIADLTSLNAAPTKFIDVIGVIRGISNIATLSIPGNNIPLTRRHIVLADESDNEMRVTLWGEAALRFNGRVIRFLGRTESAVVIFVGTTIHKYEGNQELAGADACRWYINRDVEEINILRVSISFQPVAQLPAPCNMNLQQPAWANCPQKPLSFLLDNALFQNQNGIFRCIVKVWRFIPGQRWWVALCAQCSRPTEIAVSTPTQPDKYKCLDDECSCSDASLGYLLHLLSSDDTGEAEFTLFGRVAQNMIGISAQQTILNNSPSDIQVTNLALAATQIRHTPPELASIVSCKYKFVISVTANSFRRNWASFNVLAVESCEQTE